MFKKVLSIVITFCLLTAFTNLCDARIQDAKDDAASKRAQEELTNELLDKVERRFGNEKDQLEESRKTEFSKLPRAVRVFCQKELLPALESKAHRPLLAAAESLVMKQPPEMVAAVEQYCQNMGHGVLREKVADAIVQMINQRLPMNTQAWKPVFTEYVAEGLDNGIKLKLEDFDKHPIMQDPLTLPGEWNEADKLFWNIHVWENRFRDSDQIVRAALAMNESLLAHAKKIENDEQVPRIEERMMIGTRVRAKYDEMHEREAELRIKGLVKAEETLRENDDFESRLNAAFALELHGGELDLFFQNNKPGTLNREKLNDIETPTICKNLLKSGHKNGKDVIEKALLLRLGSYWWFRGRYGSSSLAQGLLKPEFAMTNKAAMNTLFMPQERPKAIGDVDSETGAISVGYDRRHYFTWAIERRDMYLEISKNNMQSSSTTETVGESTKKFSSGGNRYLCEMTDEEISTYTPSMTKRQLKVQGADQMIPYRLVGSYEYGNSIGAFAQLLKISTPEEIEAYNNILNERPEFTYFNGVNNAFDERPNLAKADDIERTKFYDAFQKKGLSWMIALARIELGSTMSMYGTSATPFEDVFKSNFDIEATMMVLANDVASHMKSLAMEDGFKKVVKRGRDIDTWTLAYLRRLKLIRDMLGTLEKHGNNALRAEIKPYSKELAKYEKRLLDEIEDQTEAQRFSQTDISKRQQRRTRTTRITGDTIADCESQTGGTGGSGSRGTPPVIR